MPKPSVLASTSQRLASVAPAAATPNPDEHFDWFDDSVVVLGEQPATAVYFNPKGGLVIRQRGPYYDDDPFICINAENIDAFLDKLTEICGRARK
jgi:hypothetical protein